MAVSDTLPSAVHDGLDMAARNDPHVRHVLELIAGYQPDRSDRPDMLRHAARHLNHDRGEQLREQFIADAFTSRQVAELLGVADHRAVHARRARRTLLGWTVGNETHHPDWQFTDFGPVSELGRVVKALMSVTSSPVAADRMMRRRRADLEDRSLADLLADGQADLVVRLIAAADA